MYMYVYMYMYMYIVLQDIVNETGNSMIIRVCRKGEWEENVCRLIEYYYTLFYIFFKWYKLCMHTYLKVVYQGVGNIHNVAPLLRPHAIVQTIINVI